MTTPAMPRTAPAATATDDARLDSLAEAVSAIARHITGTGDERQALTRLGLTSEQADAIASTAS